MRRSRLLIESDRSLRAICVDAVSGKILHDLEVFRPDELMPKQSKNSYASPTPVIDGERVYVSFGTYGTACLDAESGRILWKNNELTLDHGVGPGSSPMIYRDLLILNCDGMDVRYVAALDKHTGRLVWKTDRDLSIPVNKNADLRKAFGTPLVIQNGGRDVLISNGAYQVSAYEPLTGKEIWVVEYDGFSNVPRPLFAHGLIYICTGFMAPQIWALRPGGQGNVTDTHVAWRVKKQVPLNASPVLVGGELYMVSDKGILTCLDAKTGKTIWKNRIGGEFSASPVHADGHLYWFDEEGITTVIEPGTTFKQIARNSLGDGFMASPAIVDHAFYLRSRSHLYRVEALSETSGR
ncbi:MAG: PQQ-binding-like beta-propeller repeat protein [Planctomycetes bacterium]|nr:PQQ-binding-like beta-propeller repeat protein [Planctomycetota bacterium]